MICTRLNTFRWLLVTGLTALNSVQAAPPAIAIIIDDLGYRYAEGQRAATLPGRVACAVIPNTPHGTPMAEMAHARGKEVLLHLPMQSLDPERPVGNEGIALNTTRVGVTEALRNGIRSIPHVAGVNNHMGSLITRHPGHMTWLMKDLQQNNLFFVDSVTTASSVALSMAREQGVRATQRDIFIDSEEATESQIIQRLETLYALARRQGQALGIAHPYPATMTVLERELPRLAQHGLRLVTVQELIGLRENAAKENADLASAKLDSSSFAAP